MQKCLSGLLADKTVVYVTHQLEFIDSSDLVLVRTELLLGLFLFFFMNCFLQSYL